MKKIIEWFINLYAIWIILAFIVGYLYPGAFMWFTKGSWMTLALAVVMLSMGLTLRVEDFKALFATPRVVLIAAISQYTIMPLSGWLVAMAMGKPVLLFQHGLLFSYPVLLLLPLWLTEKNSCFNMLVN